MRNNVDLSPSRYKTPRTSGSNKFVSSFTSKETYGGIVEKLILTIGMDISLL